MKFGKLYTQLTTIQKDVGSPPVEQSVSPAEDAARVQMKQNWQTSTITQEIVENLHNEIGELIEKSIALAISFPSHTNPHQIVQNLIRVDTLRKQVESYVKP